MIYTYPNIKLGKIKKAPKETFLDCTTDKEFDFKTGTTTQSLFYVTDNLEDSHVFHKNYLYYLQLCWDSHLGVVVMPDILWYTLLCEMASIVKESPETYRNLFSKSKEKQDIIIITQELEVMPLKKLIEALKFFVPTDATPFLPEFTTSTDRSLHAFNAAFCDLCSPYYNYFMYKCGFPYIDVRGTKEDYINIRTHFETVTKIMNLNNAWVASVLDTLKTLETEFESATFWNEMLKITHCGSGHEVQISGWITKLFYQFPKVPYIDSFSSHASKVCYKQLDTQKNYEMQVGLFYSKLEGDFLVPNYGYIVNEKRQLETCM